ncbi:APC family permease [Tessaracoccus sp. OS52]|uniref:APC family permease n=1 Tax=Tessaracoccus sp. OS52 TaxID=2886691 RepID=UPI001D11C932|nr:APC family permease [Tessaracoccus sp. OS52]MCC2592692.1 APC family permease [Tessaracoccus sp. OS52]
MPGPTGRADASAVATSELSRRLGVEDAFFIGVASMVGAGVFAVFAPAAAAAGEALLLGLLIAGFVAWCNATSSAQLAAQYPSAGGTYLYGRQRLGQWPGYFAGWSFVIGKTASCAAMAMTFAAYWAPQAWHKPVAIAVVWVLVGINYFGVTRTAQVAKVLVVIALAGLLVALGVGWGSLPIAAASPIAVPAGLGGWYGLLQSAGLMFFAFAGYARIATMGEEVRAPERTIPLAIVSALLVTLVLYAGVAVTLLMLVGSEALATASAPLMLLVASSPWAKAVLVAAALAASAGALLGLLSGIGRTWLAMARNADLPVWFATTHPVHKVPHRVDLVLGGILTLVILLADLRGAIGFSSFGVLLYYFVANVAAHTQDAAYRRYPRWLQVAGALACLVLVATLPWQSVVAGVVVLVAGVVLRLLRIRAGRIAVPAAN